MGWGRKGFGQSPRQCEGRCKGGCSGHESHCCVLSRGNGGKARKRSGIWQDRPAAPAGPPSRAGGCRCQGRGGLSERGAWRCTGPAGAWSTLPWKDPDGTRDRRGGDGSPRLSPGDPKDAPEPRRGDGMTALPCRRASKLVRDVTLRCSRRGRGQSDGHSQSTCM